MARVLRIVLDGATGRLCRTQHLAALMAIRAEGGLPVSDGTIMPEPVLLGRDPQKLASLAGEHGGLSWSTDRAACLANPAIDIYFDAGVTAGRAQRAQAAIAAGKQVYLEKPIAETFAEALALARAAERGRIRHGVVQDKIYLPGLMKLAAVRDSGALGRVLSARLDFGWWIFDGFDGPSQRASWNYRKANGGGLVLDMFPHWRYIVEHLVGPIRAVSCRIATAIPRRRDEEGMPFDVDVEDTALATFELADGALVQVNASWASRVRRDDLVVLQIDGTAGSAACGLHRCVVQTLTETPRPVWNISTERSENLPEQWREAPDAGPYRNPYRTGWDLFLRHVADGAPFPSPLIAGARGLQLIDACYLSDRERRWVELETL